uniref:Uncharacterized protein n=1 Tax=Panagrolaimus superbus TaxID=310955 RepID=A0A914Z0M3_9BILA
MRRSQRLRFFAVGVASEAGVPQYREFDILTGRYIRPDVLVKITPSICKSIKQITHNAVTCMDRLESPTKECVDRITNALEEVQQIDNLYGKIDEQKTKSVFLS